MIPISLALIRRIDVETLERGHLADAQAELNGVLERGTIDGSFSNLHDLIEEDKSATLIAFSSRKRVVSKSYHIIICDNVCSDYNPHAICSYIVATADQILREVEASEARAERHYNQHLEHYKKRKFFLSHAGTKRIDTATLPGAFVSVDAILETLGDVISVKYMSRNQINMLFRTMKNIGLDKNPNKKVRVCGEHIIKTTEEMSLRFVKVMTPSG